MAKKLAKKQDGGSQKSKYDVAHSNLKKAIAQSDSITKAGAIKKAANMKQDSIRNAKLDSLNKTPGYNFRKTGGAIKTKTKN